MTFRASLIAGIALPFAIAAPTFAGETGRLTPAIVVAQAEEACPEGEECPPTTGQGESRQERRARIRAERQRQRQEAAPVEEAAPDAPSAEDIQRRRERARARAERRQQQQQQEGAPAEEAAPEKPSAEEIQRRRQERARRRAEQQRQQEAAEQEARQEQRARRRADELQKQEAAEEKARQEERARRRAERRRQEQLKEQQGVKEETRQERAERRRQRQEAIAEEQQLTPEQIQRRRERQERRRAQRERQERQAAEENRRLQEAPPPREPGEETTTERQLEAQGDREQAIQIRRLRQKLQAERRKIREMQRQERQEDRAERREDRREERQRERILERQGNRIVVDLGGGRLVVRSEDEEESERLLYGARDVEVIELPNGRTRTIVYREDGTQIITVRNRYGEIVRRVKRYPDGVEIVLIEDIYYEQEPPIYYEPIELPPLVVPIPREEYIVEYTEASPQQIQEVLVAPPVERVERAYSVQEVTTNARVRDKMSRIDLDAITFDFGSATIGPDQMDALDELGFAMEEVIADNPEEVYLIEGHTDAVGSDADNLLLSEARAEAVAVALSQNFEIPPENLVTEGYGEQYLKIPTERPERENRRVTVRRITPLLAAEAQQ